MTDRPIIFSAPMVQALLAGRKTQTRRVLKKPAAMDALAVFGPQFLTLPGNIDLIGYAPGDRLYVREAALFWRNTSDNSLSHVAAFKADGYDLEPGERWRPSIHMPRWASRLTLTVTEVRVQRLQEISAADSIAEGVQCETCTAMGQSACHERGCFASIDSYRTLWNSLHGPNAWDTNPWICAISFTVQKGNHG